MAKSELEWAVQYPGERDLVETPGEHTAKHWVKQWNDDPKNVGVAKVMRRRVIRTRWKEVDVE